MKTLCSIAVAFTLPLLAVVPQPPVVWGLTWDQPAGMPVLSSYVPGTNQAYQVLVTQTVGLSLTNWPLLTTFTNWVVITNQGGSITLSNTVTLPFGQAFFFLNPTNIFGAAPLLSGYGQATQTGPSWSVINNSGLNKAN